jgi:hypothetical protein
MSRRSVIVVKTKFRRLVPLLRTHNYFAIAPPPRRHPRMKFNRGWHDKSIVVIRVFSNQICASRGAENSRRLAKQLHEPVSHFLNSQKLILN